MSHSSSRALSTYSEWSDPRFRQLLLFQMAFGYAYSALILVPKFATVSLGAGPREVGALAACPTLAAILISPLCGAWLDRGAHRAAMITGAFLFAAATLGFGYLRAVGPLAYGLRVLHGVGNLLIMSGAAVFVTRVVPPGHHGRAFGTAGAASLMMNAVASSATEHLADAFGWSMAYEVAGGVCAFALGVSLTQPALRERTHASVHAAPEPADAPRWRAAYATFAAGAGFGMLVTFTQPYALSLGAHHVSVLFVGYTLTALGVRLGLASAVDRWGRRRAARIALAIYAATVLVAAALTPATLLPLGLGFGFAHGLAWPALSALAVENAPSARVGSAITRMQAFFAAGTMSAVWVGGVLADAYGYAAAFIAIGIVVAAGAVGLGATQTNSAVASYRDSETR